MVTWVVTIPTFYAVTLHVLRDRDHPGARARSAAAPTGSMSWVPLLAVVSYAIIAIIAQLRLDVLGVRCF